MIVTRRRERSVGKISTAPNDYERSDEGGISSHEDTTAYSAH